MQDRLFIFVEGDDDELFFSRVVKPILKTNCIIIKYAQKRKIADYALNIKKMKADYLFVGDIDLKVCVTAKKQNLSNLYKLDEDKIIIVIKEIESWYLAGLDESRAKRFGIPIVRDTQKIDKETFEREFIPKQFKNKIDFLNEILKVFSIETAKQKNLSFQYFAEKYQLE
ncbi:MAG: hypothetical protein DRR00_24395 [Candidatus Parabeggiatoa sp. nov. 3]|nr:MAG: hypothetical protein DRR00_24395 [Gammaproteobacteria bacterium]RKZ64273.1 MAG: hypothetical protein DRQ99_15710 [Gammaproteobacteria bacterium]